MVNENSEKEYRRYVIMDRSTTEESPVELITCKITEDIPDSELNNFEKYIRKMLSDIDCDINNFTVIDVIFTEKDKREMGFGSDMMSEFLKTIECYELVFVHLKLLVSEFPDAPSYDVVLDSLTRQSAFFEKNNFRNISSLFSGNEMEATPIYVYRNDASKYIIRAAIRREVIDSLLIV